MDKVRRVDGTPNNAVKALGKIVFPLILDSTTKISKTSRRNNAKTYEHRLQRHDSTYHTEGTLDYTF